MIVGQLTLGIALQQPGIEDIVREPDGMTVRCLLGGQGERYGEDMKKGTGLMGMLLREGDGDDGVRASKARE